MPFDSKKALESWKKAKPLLLHDTGVSEVLRNLPSNPTLQQLGEFAKVDKKLEGFMADPKIKAEKKAQACLQLIRQDIKKYLEGVKATRAHIVANMELILAAARKYSIAIDKGPLTPELVASFQTIMAFRQSVRVDPRGVDHAAIPENVFRDWLGGDMNMQDTFRTMTGIMVDSQKPQPQWDTEAVMTKQIAAFKVAGGHMDRALKTAKAL